MQVSGNAAQGARLGRDGGKFKGISAPATTHASSRSPLVARNLGWPLLLVNYAEVGSTPRTTYLPSLHPQKRFHRYSNSTPHPRLTNCMRKANTAVIDRGAAPGARDVFYMGRYSGLQVKYTCSYNYLQRASECRHI